MATVSISQQRRVVPRGDGTCCSRGGSWEGTPGSLAGKPARSPGPALSRPSAHSVFFSDRKDMQTAALQPKRCCSRSCRLGGGGSASSGCCSAGTRGTQWVRAAPVPRTATEPRHRERTGSSSRRRLRGTPRRTAADQFRAQTQF